MTAVPNRIENPEAGKSARLRRVSGSDRYYLDLYTHERDGSPRYSTCGPDSRLTFTRKDALRKTQEWCAT